MADKNKFYRIQKVVVNMGIGEGAKDKAVIEAASRDLMAISGQKPSPRRARMAIAGFKIRKGDPIGLAVTLRGKRMKDFLNKLLTIVLPKLRDFQGISLKSFDGHGNYNLGISEQIVFPEIDYAKVDKIRGLQITLVTNIGHDEEARKFLQDLGMPFEKAQGKPKEKNGQKS